VLDGMLFSLMFTEHWG